MESRTADGRKFYHPHTTWQVRIESSISILPLKQLQRSSPSAVYSLSLFYTATYISLGTNTYGSPVSNSAQLIRRESPGVANASDTRTVPEIGAENQYRKTDTINQHENTARP